MGLLNDSYFSRGNVVSPYQYSGYVRAYNKTECNGMTWPVGHLQKFDLESPRFEKMPPIVKVKVMELARDNDVIVYAIKHYSRKNKCQVIDGYIVTDTNHFLLYRYNFGRFTGFNWDYINKAVKQITAK